MSAKAARRVPAPPPPEPARFRLPDGSRSVQSVWVWRAFLFLSLIALGLCIGFAAGGHLFHAVAWAVIAAGWFGISMWLWRQHLRSDDAGRGPQHVSAAPQGRRSAGRGR